MEWRYDIMICDKEGLAKQAGIAPENGPIECPFCGSEFLAFITVGRNERVMCTMCGATGPTLRVNGQLQDTAIKAWNMNRGRRS